MMKKILFLACAMLLLAGFKHPASDPTLMTNSGVVQFTSEASEEIIKAESKMLVGVLNLKTKEFAFKVMNRSFKGFNSPLQEDHFHEDYMETQKFPYISFKGKITDATDLSKEGTYKVSAKGELEAHGVKKERTVPAELKIKDGEAIVSTNFTVPLSDHKIKIPELVHLKISENIKVDVYAVLKKEK